MKSIDADGSGVIDYTEFLAPRNNLGLRQHEFASHGLEWESCAGEAATLDRKHYQEARRLYVCVCVCVNASSSRYKEGSGVVRMHTIFTCGIGFHGSRKMLAGKPSESLTAMAMAPSVRRSPWLSGTRRSSFAEWILSHPKSAAAGCSTNPSDFGIISKRDSEPTVRNSFDT